MSSVVSMTGRVPHRHLRSPRRFLRGTACLLVLWVLTHNGPWPDWVRGQRFFEGQEALPARIAGQDFALPVQAGRCINCHGRQAPQRIGPLLTADSLTDATSRRGGPPTRYERSSFCRLLRTGVDPAFVILPRSMPRYDLSDADCADLWAYLVREAR
jgi:hypothetical protein